MRFKGVSLDEFIIFLSSHYFNNPVKSPILFSRALERLPLNACVTWNRDYFAAIPTPLQSWGWTYDKDGFVMIWLPDNSIFLRDPHHDQDAVCALSMLFGYPDDTKEPGWLNKSLSKSVFLNRHLLVSGGDELTEPDNTRFYGVFEKSPQNIWID